jgi:rhodanese-related sulfurtransferase
MTGTQIIFYMLFAAVLVFYIRRLLLSRSITHYTPSEVAAKMKTAPSPLLLDVRTRAERSSQHITGSLHIPLHELGARIGELDRFKGKEIICYCRSGNRSIVAAARLRRHGFAVANMKGGIVEWNFSALT